MLRPYLCLLWLACWAATGLAQGIKPPSTGVGIIYNKETTFNLRVYTNRGFAPGMEFGKLITYDKTRYFMFNIGELKHPKEVRQSADPTVSRSFRPYVYGKQNTLLALRAGWGTKKYYSEKAKQKGVAIGLSYSLGPTLGLLKPYYLALRYTGSDPGFIRSIHEKYSADNAKIFLDNSRILGASPFTTGLTEMSFLPGANACIAFHMDWGAFDEFVKALEIGFMVDAFVKKAPIMVTEENRQFFFNFFVNLQLGKRR
jgi:hypothetical protein